MLFTEVIKSRYSVRKFDARPVEPEKIGAILEAARIAPTAVNKQPQRILVLEAQEDMQTLAQCTKYAFDAPAALIVACKEDAAWVRPYDKKNSGVIDASIAGTYIMLAIRDLGLGTCWVGMFDPQAVREKFNFPPDYRPVAVFPFGYPAADSTPSAKHDQRLPLEALVSYKKF